MVSARVVSGGVCIDLRQAVKSVWCKECAYAIGALLYVVVCLH